MSEEMPLKIVLELTVAPGAQRTEFAGKLNGRLRVLLKAQPQDNKANEELIRFLSKEFKTPQKNISITAGLKSKHKTIQIHSPRKIP